MYSSDLSDLDDELEMMLDDLESADLDGDELDDVDDVDDLGDAGDAEDDPAATLRWSLHDDYADALPEELDDVLDAMFESLSPAEAFNLGKALQQIERGASQVLSNPAVAQIARTTLPLAGGAVGTLVGGPAGTALGSSLGGAAAKALPGARPAAAVTGATNVARPAAALASGSPAAAQGLILTQQPQVLQSLLAAALGPHGRNEINGVPVGAVLGMLSSIFGQAAAEADELLDADADAEHVPVWTGSRRHPIGDPADPVARARSLYACILDDESDELGEVAW